MNIDFGNQKFWLDPSGILFWPDKSLLVVADLHLEKGSHFASRGFFLPPYDSHETLERLHQVCRELAPRQILILGDCFHDENGHARLLDKSRTFFDALLAYNPIWVYGNHDGDFVPTGFVAYETYELGNIVFRHEASSGSSNEISGHFHPKIDIAHKNALISRDCFIEDGHKMILPAFGSYTGGLSIEHPSIAVHMNDDRRVYVLGDKKIFFFQK